MNAAKYQCAKCGAEYVFDLSAKMIFGTPPPTMNHSGPPHGPGKDCNGKLWTKV